MSTELREECVVRAQLHEEQPNVEQNVPATDAVVSPNTPCGHSWAWMAVATVAVLLGAAGGWYVRGQRPAASETPDATQQGSPSGKATLGFAHDVAGDVDDTPSGRGETVSIEIIRLPNRLRVTGSLTADEQSSVASNANGIVAEVRVDRGSVVKKGDVLVQLDATDAKNKLAEGLALVDELKAKLTWGDASDTFVAEEQPAVKLAVATLALATSRKNRAETLAQKNAVSADECEQSRSECECAVQRHRQALQQVRQDHQAYLTAVSRLAASRKAVADATILAPFDGMVVEKHVAVGEQVTGGFIASKVITLGRINPLRVWVTVPQQSIGQVKQGQKLLFHVDSYPGKTFTAEVRYISPVVTSDTRSLLVEAVADNLDGALRPGLFVTAELELAEQQSEMWVPVAAVQRTGRGGDGLCGARRCGP